ncbi:MAG TPA: immunity 53 family protein [Gemmatimonadaceae bacterium]|nr:immunity 53 family protein [Gemmatimonadaceae bacterium]
MDELRRLQEWYTSQCDGDWEHEYGIRIVTLDNPGWAVHIPLAETELEHVPFVEVVDRDSERDWVHCRVRDGQWRGSGGPQMLARLLGYFLDWAATATRAAT